MYQKKAYHYNISSLSSRATQQLPTLLVTMNSQLRRILTAIFVSYLFLAVLCFAQTSATNTLSILFFGRPGRHQSSLRAQEFIPVMATRGINITYTENFGDFNAATLAKYDGLIVYADTVLIDPAQEKALIDYVASGKGFIAIHCAISFFESPKYCTLVGAQFKYHSTGNFRTRVVTPKHPIMNGFREFETSDETYFHSKPSPDCTVLLVRRENDRDEPWTWVRTHGKGRVFYTAYGHDERTWKNPEFQSLLERGIRWSCGNISVLDSSPQTDRK